ncbi:MAG: N-acetylmuramoyl-L-alanine amidase [Bacteroidota bacterium]
MKAIFVTLALALFIQGAAQGTIDKYFFAKTTGKLAFLKYGLGIDRLGGAKMGFLDSNIVLKVIDSFGIDYKVQLSKFHTAYIEKHNLQRLPNKKSALYHLTSSWKVFGDDKYDYVSINLDEKLPYHSQQQINPSRIVLDIFGATSNTNWITQLKTTKEIKNVYYEQTEDDVFRVIVELKHAQHWGYSVYYDTIGQRLVLQVKRQPPVLDIRKLRIAVDAGHGGDNSGASGIGTNVLEKEYTLKIAKQLQATLLRAGIKNVFMTRTKDTTLDMPQRLQLLKDFSPDLLVSIHLNSSDIDTVKGTSTYYRYIGFRPLTTAILRQMLSLGLKEYGNVGNFNFSLNGPTAYPNCLVEVAFLSNRQEEKKILSPKFHKAVAQKIYLGIQDWLKAIK